MGLLEALCKNWGGGPGPLVYGKKDRTEKYFLKPSSYEFQDEQLARDYRKMFDRCTQMDEMLKKQSEEEQVKALEEMDKEARG